MFAVKVGGLLLLLLRRIDQDGFFGVAKFAFALTDGTGWNGIDLFPHDSHDQLGDVMSIAFI